mgnify:CR=1 FL=1
MNYEIKGGNLPVVICTLQPGETMVTESGAMSWMSPNMKMETGAKGGLGGAFGQERCQDGAVNRFRRPVIRPAAAAGAAMKRSDDE